MGLKICRKHISLGVGASRSIGTAIRAAYLAINPLLTARFPPLAALGPLLAPRFRHLQPVSAAYRHEPIYLEIETASFFNCYEYGVLYRRTKYLHFSDPKQHNLRIDPCHIRFVVCPSLLQRVFGVFVNIQDRLRAGSSSFGVYVSCLEFVRFGVSAAVPVVVGSSDPSVPRSPGVSPQKCWAAHAPRHPAFHRSPGDVVSMVWFLCSVFGGRCWFFYAFFSGVGKMFGLVPFKARPVSVCCLCRFFSQSLSLSLSLYLSLFGMFADAVFYLSQALGKCKRFSGLRFP